MREIQALGVGPVYAEFVVAAAGGNMRMAASGHVRVDANGDGWRSNAATAGAAGFFQQDFQLGFRFHIEEQYSRLAAAFCGAVPQGFANFLTCFADAGKTMRLPGTPIWPRR